MPCPACDATESHARPLLPSLTVHQCSRCGLLTSEIRSTRAISYDDVDDASYEASIGALRRQQSLEVLNLARQHVSTGNWLDIGCGPGYLLAEACAAGFHVRGFEPDAKAAALARTRLAGLECGGDSRRSQQPKRQLRPPVIEQDLFRHPEDDSADVVSTLDVLEHVPVPELPDFAARIRRTLRRNGLWLIKAPSSEGLFFRVAHAFRLRAPLIRLWQAEHASPHTVYFDRATLTAFLERHGFEVVAHRYLAEVPLKTALARLTLDRSISRWQAMLALPAIAAVNLIETIRRRSDAIVVLARPR